MRTATAITVFLYLQSPIRALVLHKKSLDFSSIKYLLIFNKPGPYRKDWLMEMKMKILKTLLLIPFLMFGKSALADTTISLGAGVQHGGLMLSLIHI